MSAAPVESVAARAGALARGRDDLLAFTVERAEYPDEIVVHKVRVSLEDADGNYSYWEASLAEGDGTWDISRLAPAPCDITAAAAADPIPDLEAALAAADTHHHTSEETTR